MFPMQITLTINNATELASISTITAAMKDGGVAKATEAKKSPPPAAEKNASSPSGAQHQTTEKAESAPVKEEKQGGKQYTVDEAKVLVRKLVNDKGRDVAIETLAKYSAKTAAELKPEQVAGFCADAEALLAS